MDKKDIIEKIKEFVTAYGFLTIPLMVIILVISVLSFIIKGDIKIFINNILSIVIFVAVIFTIIGLVYLFLILRRKSEMVSNTNYVRELPKYFPPAVASLVLDLSIENTTDYTATIAYLISKKYIKLSKDGGEIEVISDNQLFKSRHEDYAFQCITNKKKFSQHEFNQLVIEDAKRMGLIERGKRKVHFVRNVFLALCGYFGFGAVYKFCHIEILQNICLILAFLCGISMLAIPIFSVYLSDKYRYENIRRTLKGRIEAKKWTGIKNYIRDYTLLSDKNLKDITIFDDYIPYAIALNEAKAVEEFIQNNEAYRKLMNKELHL